MENSYLSFLPKELIYILLYKISVNDITSNFPNNLLNIFLAYNRELNLCYLHIFKPVIISRDFFFSNMVALCYVLTPEIFEMSLKVTLGDWDYFYYTTFSKLTVCQQDYGNISKCYGTEPSVYNDNNFWKGLIVSLLRSVTSSYQDSRKAPIVTFPDFVNYRRVYPILVNLLEIRYIINIGTVNGIMLLNGRYTEYLTHKIQHEISQLKSIDKDFYKVVVVAFLRDESLPNDLGTTFILLKMISDIHNLDPVSLEILYHLLHNDKTKVYMERIYDSHINLLSRIIVPYISVTTTSPNIADFYLIPILNSIKDVPNFKPYISDLLFALSMHPQDYNIDKISALRSTFL